MRAEQTVNEMAQEVLWRQARAGEIAQPRPFLLPLLKKCVER